MKAFKASLYFTLWSLVLVSYSLAGTDCQIYFISGDILNGEVQNQELSIQAAYGNLNIYAGDIASIRIQGKRSQIFLRAGDKIFGELQNAAIDFILTDGTEITINQDDIKSMVFDQSVASAQSASGNSGNKVVVIPLFGNDATGNAQTIDVLLGKTFSNSNKTGLRGIMPNIGQEDIYPGTTDQFISEGYHDGSGLVYGDTNLISNNICSGISIFGVSGNSNVVDTSSGNALAGDLLSGKKAFVDGSEITGTIATQTLSNANQTVNAGYYAATTLSAVDADLATGNIRSGVSVFGVAGSSDVVNTSTGDILSGKKAYVAGGEITGSMANNGAFGLSCGSGDQGVTAGYYNGGALTGDVDLISTNIRSGANIFGVPGNSNVVNTSTGDAVAGDILSGKKAYVAGGEVTGTANCVTCSGIMNGTRWCDNEDGTVTDMTTGLIWLQNASSGGEYPFWVNTASGTNAHDRAASFTADGNAELNDGSVEGDWRLPTITELEKLATGAEYVRSDTPRAFTGVQSHYYWSSSTTVGNTDYAWDVYIGGGNLGDRLKTSAYYVWPVRGGQ